MRRGFKLSKRLCRQIDKATERLFEGATHKETVKEVGNHVICCRQWNFRNGRVERQIDVFTKESWNDGVGFPIVEDIFTFKTAAEANKKYAELLETLS